MCRVVDHDRPRFSRGGSTVSDRSLRWTPTSFDDRPPAYTAHKPFLESRPTRKAKITTRPVTQQAPRRNSVIRHASIPARWENRGYKGEHILRLMQLSFIFMKVWTLRYPSVRTLTTPRPCDTSVFVCRGRQHGSPGDGIATPVRWDACGPDELWHDLSRCTAKAQLT